MPSVSNGVTQDQTPTNLFFFFKASSAPCSPLPGLVIPPGMSCGEVNLNTHQNTILSACGEITNGLQGGGGRSAMQQWQRQWKWRK